MVQGILGLPEVENPQRAADQNQQQMVQQGLKLGLAAPPTQGGGQQQQGYMNPESLKEIYGILAQGNNPAAAGQGYVSAMQTQQRADRANAPMSQWLELYGNINPYDFTVDSLQKFHENTIETGQLKFDLLERVETLSTKEQGFLNEAINSAQDKEMQMSRMINLADRFEQAGMQGMKSGALASLEDWFMKFAGTEDDFRLLKTEYDQVKNTGVMEALPPGIASDKDIEIAMRGWPGATANPEYLSAFLRGMAKMRAFEHAQQAHAARFLSRNRTQQGQLADWQKNRDVLMLKSLDRFGGVYNPLNADGTPIAAEDAARLRFGSPKIGDTTVTTPAQQSSGFDAAGEKVKQTIDDLLKLYPE